MRSKSTTHYTARMNGDSHADGTRQTSRAGESEKRTDDSLDSFSCDGPQLMCAETWAVGSWREMLSMTNSWRDRTSEFGRGHPKWTDCLVSRSTKFRLIGWK